MSGAGSLLAWGVALAAPLVAMAAFRQGLERALRPFLGLIAVYVGAVGVIAVSRGAGAVPGMGFVLVSGGSGLVAALGLYLFAARMGGGR